VINASLLSITTASVSQISMRCHKVIRHVSSAAMPDKPIGVESQELEATAVDAISTKMVNP
jgi:hypothetical protein